MKQKHTYKIQKRNKRRNEKSSGFSFGLGNLFLIGRAAHKAFWEILIPYFKDLAIRGMFKNSASPLEIALLVAVLGSLEVVLLKTIQVITNLLAQF